MTPIPGVQTVTKAKREKNRPKEQPVGVWEGLLAPMLLGMVLIAARLIGPEGLIAGGVFMVCAAIMFGTITGRPLPALKATKLLINVINQYRRGRR